MANQIRFGVGFDVDKSGLNALKSELESLSKMSVGEVMKINTSNITDAKTQLETIRKTASTVQDALSKAFNQKLNTVNVQTFNNELSKSKMTVQQVYQNLSLAGTQGTNAFRSLANQVTSTNVQLKQTHNILDKMATTLSNTIKWNMASGAVNALSGSIQQAYGYVKALDGSLNDIQIVTQKSSEDMAAFAKRANDAAKALGSTTVAYSDASLIFYQQGLSDEEVQARTDLTTKVANASGLSAKDAAEYVTAVLNGYKVGSEEAEAAMDKLAAVGANTASSLAELSEGMSKVASTANAMGVSEDQLAASLSTVIAATRQEASSVGTAFKTIFMRISDIKTGADDAEVSLGNYTKQMAEMGVHVLDSNGQLRDQGEVMEEIGNRWADMSREQQIALARTMAGTRQANNLIALFDNWDEYIRAVNVSMESNGTLQQQQNTHMESTRAHLNQMATSWEKVYKSMLDADTINTVADGLGKIGDVTAAWIDSIGGGAGVLKTLGSLAVMVFSKQISASINTTINNFLTAKNNAQQLAQAMQSLQQFEGIKGLDKATTELLTMKDSFYQLSQVMSPESFQAIKTEFDKFTQSANLVDTLNADKNAMEQFLKQFESKHLKIDGLETLSKNFDKIEEEILLTQNALGKATKEIRQYGSALQQATKANDWETAKSSAKSMFAVIENLNDEGNLSKVAFERASKAMENYNNIINNTGHTVAEETAAFERLRVILSSVVTSESHAFDGMADKIRNEFSGASESIIVALEKAEAEAKRTGISIQTALQNAARQEVIANFTKIAGAISSMTFAVQTFQNLGSIWKDKDADVGDKVLKTVTTLATALPMLVSGYTSLLAGIKGVTAAKKTYAAATAALTAAEVTETGITISATAALLDFGAALLASPFTWALAAIIAITAVWRAYKSSVEAATEAEKKRAETATDDALAIRDQADNINTLYNKYKESYKIFQDTGTNEDTLRQCTLDLAEAFGVQIDTMDLLAGRYDKINKKIAETRAAQAKEALDKAREGANSANRSLMLNAGATNSQDNSRRDIIFNVGLSSADKEDVMARQYVDDAIAAANIDMTSKGNMGSSGEWGAILGLLGIAEEDFTKAYEAISEAYDRMTTEMSAQDLGHSELYSSIGAWLEDNDEYYQKYIQLQNDIQTYATQYAEAAAALNASDFDITKIENVDQFKQYREDYKNALKEALQDKNGEIAYDESLYDSTDDYLNYLTDAYLGTIDYISEYLEEAKLGEDLVRRMTSGMNDEEAKEKIRQWVDSLSGEELKLIATIDIDEGATQEEVEKALELAQSRAQHEVDDVAVNNVVGLLSQDTLKSKDSKELAEGIQELEVVLRDMPGIYNDNITAAEEWSQVSQQGTLAQIEYLEDLREEQSSYGKVTEETVRHEIELEKELLKAKRERRIKAETDLNEKISNYDVATTEKEKTAIFATAEAYEEAKKQAAAYQREVLELDNQIQGLEDTLANGDFEFEIDMSDVKEILTIGDNILSEGEKIKQAAELIGEGFKVAAEDADALAAIFPELYENAQVTADGIVQLDKATVQSLLGGQGAILNGDTQTSIAIIDNKIAELEAKKAAAEAELEIYQQVAQGDVDMTKEELEAISQGRQDLTNYLIQLGVSETEANAAVAQAMAGNYDELNRIVAEHAGQMDQNLTGAIKNAASNTQANASNMVASLMSVLQAAQQAAIAVAGVGTGTVQGSKVSGAAGGATGGGTYKANASNGNFKITNPNLTPDASQFLSSAINQTNLDISGYTSAIAQMQALKAKLLANQKAAQSALDGASSGLGGKPSKGGAGGSGKGNKGKNTDKDAEQIDSLQDEEDIYHDIDIEIKNITRDLKKLQKEQEHLSGKDLINNLDKQLDILQKQKQAYADKIELAKMEAGAYKTALEAYGATFDKDGQISNYFSFLDSELQQANDVIARYNNLSADKQTEEEKEKVEEAKKRYAEVQQLVTAYDNLINDTIPDLEEQITDVLYAEIEIQITKFDMEVQLRLDMSEAERDWNKFKRKVIDGIDDDDLLANAQGARNDFLSYYRTTDANGNVISTTGSLQSGTNKVNTILDELAAMDAGGHSSIYSAYDATTGTWVDDRKAAIDDLKSSYTELMTELEALTDLENEIEQSFLDSIDAVQDAYDKQSEIYEFFGKQIEHDLKMIQLLYGEKAYGKMAEYYDKQIESDKTQVENLQSQVGYWKQMMDAAREAGDEEAYAKYRDNWMKSVEDLNSKIEQWAENLANRYANTINDILDQLNKKLTDGAGLDYIEEELKLLQDNADDYLDTINSSYALQNLRNEWQDAIDATDSIQGQKQLNELMQQQLDYLEQKGELTQYDIDRAELEYQIALKQIALQDAQQNKSKMRLKRDANGNYSYQYTSDEDSIAQAQRDLAAAQNELYNFDKSAYQNNLNEIYSTWNEFQEKIAQAYIDYADDDEKRTEVIALLQEQYGEKINRLTENNLTIREKLQESAFTNLAALYDTDVANFQNMSTAEKDIILNDLIPTWNSGIQEMADKFAGDGGFKDSCTEAFDQLGQAADAYNEKQLEIGNISDQISQQVMTEQQTLQTESWAAVDAAQQELLAIQEVRTEVQGLIQDYKDARDAAVAASQAAYSYWQQEQANSAGGASNGGSGSNSGNSGGASANSNGGSSSQNPSGSSSGTGSSGGSGRTATADMIKGIAAAIWCEDNSGWGDDPGRKQKLTAKFNANTASQIQSYINAHADNGDLYNYWVSTLKKNASAYHYDKFYHGGLANYTGPAWVDGTPSNPEMVLNPQDTENMLNAVAILRNIVNSLDTSVWNTASKMLSSLGSTRTQSVSASTDTIEQIVHITATFEGQTEAAQIQTALDNLVNIASQRAYRFKK